MLISNVSKLALYNGTPIRKDPYPEWPVSGPREQELLLEVLASGKWGAYNEFVGRFESLFAKMHDCEHGIAVANGTLAIELALIAAGIQPGEEVIVPAHSFISTASAVSRVGAIPVFVDIEDETFNIDPDKIDAAVSPKTKAVIIVHFAGQMADVDRIAKSAAEHNLIVIEDAAHAHGAEWKGQRAGSFGLCGTFSFQNTKVMTAGEGGIITTNDDEFAARARSIANTGRRPDQGWFHHFELGSNFRITAFQAAVLLAQLERLVDQILRRGQNSDAVGEAPQSPGVRFQKAPESATPHAFYLLVGRIDEGLFGVHRDEFVRAMRAEGVPCDPFYPHPLYENPMYGEALAHRAEPCPVAEQVCKDSFWLPMRTLMGSKEDALDIVRAIDKVHQAYKPAVLGGEAAIN
jgi:dTDP-4-amino-4,6-dideoxygalactose transaminase